MRFWEGKGGNTIADSKYLKLFLHFLIPAPSSLHFPSPTTRLLKSLFVLCALPLSGRTCLQHDHQGGNFVYREKPPLWEGHVGSGFLSNFGFLMASHHSWKTVLLTGTEEREAVFITQCWHLIWTSPLKFVILGSLCTLAKDRVLGAIHPIQK